MSFKNKILIKYPSNRDHGLKTLKNKEFIIKNNRREKNGIDS